MLPPCLRVGHTSFVLPRYGSVNLAEKFVYYRQEIAVNVETHPPGSSPKLNDAAYMSPSAIVVIAV